MVGLEEVRYHPVVIRVLELNGSWRQGEYGTISCPKMEYFIDYRGLEGRP